MRRIPDMDGRTGVSLLAGAAILTLVAMVSSCGGELPREGETASATATSTSSWLNRKTSIDFSDVIIAQPP